MLINYAGPEGTFRRVPFSALIDGTAQARDFNGKIIFLGVTAQGGGDRIFTPLPSRIGMSGIEIHANVARTILDRDFLTALSESGRFRAGNGNLGHLCAGHPCSPRHSFECSAPSHWGCHFGVVLSRTPLGTRFTAWDSGPGSQAYQSRQAAGYEGHDRCALVSN